MKSISVREFQLHATKYLKELPIVLTQYNLPVATVNPFVTDVLTEYGLNTQPSGIPSTSPSTSESPFLERIPELQNELSKLIARYPNIKLFGKTRACPFCSEQIPIELAQKHYDEKHEGA